MKETLFSLSQAVSAGTLREASELAFRQLSQYAVCEKTDNLTVIGTMKGESDYTLLLDAHIDEIAMIVTSVDEEGFLTVAKCGGIDLRTLPARPVTVHGKNDIPAVFCSTPPHLSSGETEYDDITKLKLDTLLGKKAREFISVGDYVTFSAKPVALAGSRVTGKSFDDRAGVTCLLELARRLSGKTIPVNVVFVFSDQEELGMRGARTAAFRVSPDEAVAIDVSFGDGPDISPYECGMLGEGAMIGLSPVLDSAIGKKMIGIADEKNIPYQTEVMGAKTGTNSDMISLTKSGVRTGLVSIPLRNMHTDVEVVDLDDMTSLCDILEEYILTGGVRHD